MEFLCKDAGEVFGEEVGRKRPAPSLEALQSRPRPICHAWQKGACTRGAQCKYAHPPKNVHPMPKRIQFGSPSSTRLVIESIPLELLNIAALHGYFARFGTIVKMDLEPEAGRAKLEFTEASAAKAAYDCPEAVFGNRFIRILWEHEAMASRPVKGLSPAAAASRLNPQQELLRKRQETLEAFLTLQSQKEALLQRYLAEKARLLHSLSSMNGEGADRSPVLSELQAIEAAIETVRPAEKPALAQAVQPILRGPSRPVSRSEAAPIRPRQTYNLDLRPKAIRMTPVPAKVGRDPAAIRKFFEPYGQVASLQVEEGEGGSVSAVVAFVNRWNAERALHYLTQSEKDVEITWEQSK